MDQNINKGVFVYSTPTCHFCLDAKDYFNQNGVSFTEFDVSSDAEKRQSMIDLTGQKGVPVIVIDDQVVIGFNKSKIYNSLVSGGYIEEEKMAA